MTIGTTSLGEFSIGEPGQPGPTPPYVLPMSLSGFLVQPAASLPMRLAGLATTGAQSIPLRLEASDPAHYLAASASFGVAAILEGVALPDQVGPIRIRELEDAATVCSLSFVPAPGVIDPAAYERKHLTVDFIAYDSAGAELYQVRQFTGTTTVAAYDPDAGIVRLTASTDLQGWLENLDKEVIDAQVGGEWSPHIFDETADGYQYALDRLSTQAAEMHIDARGRFTVAAWSAKATPDVTLTDSGRFNDSLTLTRTSRRELLSRVRVRLDFRFVRLRHRELTVRFANTLGFCHYLNNNWPLASKDMVRSAADGTEWTRVTDISFEDTPGVGVYCDPPRGWVGGAESFCLGAEWKAARRWAQTVTENYSLDLVASDLEGVIGRTGIVEYYGIESTYDASEYERIKSFDAPPTGSTYDAAAEDYLLEATDAEYDGRVAMEAAQTCALAKARSNILGRARGNRLRLSSIFRPDITLESTVRVNTPHLVAKGKVAGIEKTIDASAGLLDMALEIALSRHDGSGTAADDQLDPAPQPAPQTETSTGRLYVIPYRLGGVEFAPEDNAEWDGYMTNPQESLRFPGAPVYRQRFVVRMPEIETTARDASGLEQPAAYDMTIPNDELTMSN